MLLPRTRADVWLSAATDSSSSAPFAIKTVGSHYVEAATVDRADNVGEVSEHPQLAPRCHLSWTSPAQTSWTPTATTTLTGLTAAG